VATYHQGQIVWVRVSDQAGRNPKTRPAVILTATDEISDDEPIVVVAVSTRFDRPLPDNKIELPWHRDRHPVTGLRRRCVAVCDWLVEIRPSAIEDVAGTVPPAKMRQIISRVKRAGQ